MCENETVIVIYMYAVDIEKCFRVSHKTTYETCALYEFL